MANKPHVLQDIRPCGQTVWTIFYCQIEVAQLCGNFGDYRSVGQGVSEMRVHFGPGYRVYFTRVGNIVYVLLCGGTKRNQQRDIEKAKEIARLLKEK